MDGLGYHNWGKQSSVYDDDQSDQSPPTYNSDHYAFSAETSPQSKSKPTKVKSGGNIYDYSIENDDDNDYEMSPEPSTKRGKDTRAKSFGRSESSKRLSTEDRMKEILERNNAEKKNAAPASQEDDFAGNTWKSSWDDLLEGVNSPEPSNNDGRSDTKSPASDAKQRRGSGAESPTDSSFGDFEISASDFEVGTIAARLNKEKASDRTKEKVSPVSKWSSSGNAIKATPEKTRPLIASDSPVLAQHRKEPDPKNFKMSTAISAIYSLGNDGDEDPSSSADGSKGDNDLYKILAKTNENRRSNDKQSLQRQSSETDFSSMITSGSGSSSQNSSPLRMNIIKHTEDEADYSSDDFEGPESNDISDVKPITKSASVVKFSKIEEKKEEKVEKVEIMSKEEIERRKSFELIKQRWLVSSVEVTASVSSSIDPPRVTPGPLKINENEKSGVGVILEGDEGEEDTGDSNEESSNFNASGGKDDGDEDNEESYDNDNNDDNDESYDNNRGTDRQNSYEDNNMSMISHNKIDEDGDRVNEGANFPASSRYTNADGSQNLTNSNNSESQTTSLNTSSYNQSRLGNDNNSNNNNNNNNNSNNSKYENPSAFPQSDLKIGSRLLTAIGSNSMVTSFPPPNTVLTISETYPGVSSTSSYPHTDRPGGPMDVLRYGVADIEGEDGDERFSQSENYPSGFNRRSVTFQNDRDNTPSFVPSFAPSFGLSFVSSEAPKGVQEFLRRDESESHLNRPPFSHVNPQPIRMFQPYNAHPTRPVPFSVMEIDVPGPAPRYTEDTQSAPPNNYGITLSIDDRMKQNAAKSRVDNPASDPTQSSRGIKGRPVGQGKWPHDLPMTAPSSEDLYAQLAMISSAAERRVALASVKAKANSKNKRGTKAPSQGLAATMPTNSAMNRIEQGTARLSRQFDSLQKEIVSLSMKSKGGNAPARVPDRGLSGASADLGSSSKRGGSQSFIPVRGGGKGHPPGHSQRQSQGQSQGKGPGQQMYQGVNAPRTEEYDGTRDALARRGLGRGRNSDGERSRERVRDREREKDYKGRRADRDDRPMSRESSGERQRGGQTGGQTGGQRGRVQGQGTDKGQTRGSRDQRKDGGRGRSGERNGGRDDDQESEDFTEDEDRPRQAWKEETDTSMQPYGESNWGLQALETMQKIVDSGAILSQREKELRAREEELKIKESLSKAAMEERFGASTAEIQLESLLLEKEKMKHLSESKEHFSLKREQELLTEIERLKSLLFSISQERDTALEKVEALYLEKVTAAEDGRRERENESIRPMLPVKKNRTVVADTKGADGEEQVTLLKKEYDSLLAECSSQEILIAGFQKENEKLLLGVNTRDRENTVAKAIFFDQQENLNKEVNRLRNMVGEIPKGLEYAYENNENIQNNNKNERNERDGFISFSTPHTAQNAQDAVKIFISSSQVFPKGEGGVYIQKSADTLRAELEKDAFVRHLKERAAIAESGAGVREKELQLTIEKLRRDNRQLAATTVNMSVTALTGQRAESDGRELEAIQRRHAGEVRDLKGKLAWYAENQQLLEESERTKSTLRATVNSLRAELKKRGIVVKEKTGGGGGVGVEDHDDVDERDTSMISSATFVFPGTGCGLPRGGGVGGMGKTKYIRHPGDVKKIKELEVILTDLQENMRKRNPDSVSNLIFASRLTDAEQEEKNKQNQLISDLREELADIKDDYDSRLRSLRQEHEKVKLKYEDREPSKAETASKEHSSARPSKNHLAAPKTLPLALIKIKQLEDEVEKLRTFYTRKIEELQRKTDAQMRSLKRGSDVGGGGNAEDADSAMKMNNNGNNGNSNGDGDNNEGSNENKRNDEDYSDSGIDIQVMKIQYEKELSALQSELKITNDTLSILRASALINPTSPDSYANKLQLEQLKSAETELLKLQFIKESEQKIQSERLKWQGKQEESTENERERRDKHDRERTEEKDLRDELKGRLREEEMKVSQLSSEVLRLQAHLEGPKTPQMAQFMALESHLRMLEGRADRRERELQATVDDVKSTSKIEYARLQAIHSQECREKDEQLVRFQGDLEQLVRALKQWQNAATSNTTSFPSNTTSFPSNTTSFPSNTTSFPSKIAMNNQGENVFYLPERDFMY